MKEPNIGIRLKTPVMRPNGKARPASSLKMTHRINVTVAVQHALISATVRALETYLLTTLPIRLITLCVRDASRLPLKLAQNWSRMAGPSVSMKRARTSTRMVAAMKPPIAPMLVAKFAPRSLTIVEENFWIFVMISPWRFSTPIWRPKSLIQPKLFDTVLIVSGKLRAKLTVSLIMVGTTIAKKAERQPMTRMYAIAIGSLTPLPGMSFASF